MRGITTEALPMTVPPTSESGRMTVDTRHGLFGTWHRGIAIVDLNHITPWRNTTKVHYSAWWPQAGTGIRTCTLDYQVAGCPKMMQVQWSCSRTQFGTFQGNILAGTRCPYGGCQNTRRGFTLRVTVLQPTWWARCQVSRAPEEQLKLQWEPKVNPLSDTRKGERRLNHFKLALAQHCMSLRASVPGAHHTSYCISLLLW